MGQLCSRVEPGKTDRSIMPHHVRIMNLMTIEQCMEKAENLPEALRTFALLCRDLEVCRDTLLASNLGIVDLLQLRHFLVDSKAHDSIRRLHEALITKQYRQAANVCKDLIAHFNRDKEGHITPPKLHRKFFGQVNLKEIKMIGWSLNHRPTFLQIKYMLSKNNDLRKLTLSFSGMSDFQGEVLLYTLLRFNTKLYYLGLKGNNLTRDFITTLTDILKDRYNFPFLCWVDVRNNDGINILPSSLMKQLKKRWINKFRKGEFLSHKGEEARIMKAIGAVVRLNDKIKKHVQLQAKEERKERIVEEADSNRYVV